MDPIRWVKIILVVSIGVWGFMGALGNLSSLSSVYDQVIDVTTMSGVPEGIGPPWRTANPVVVWIGVATIVLGKLAAMAGGFFGAAHMLRHVRASATDFNKSKKWAIAGSGLAFALTAFSFILVAESMFFVFFDQRYAGAGEMGFRLAAWFALVAIFVAQPEVD